MTPDPRLAALRALAEKAVPGPWTYEDMGQTVMCRSHDFLGGASNSPGPFKVADIRGWGFLQYRVDGEVRMEATGEYIAAANPQAILAILDALAAAEGERDRLRGDHWSEAVLRYAKGPDSDPIRGMVCSHDGEFVKRTDFIALTQERDALAARLAGAEKRLAWFRHTHEDCEDIECMDCGVLDCPNFDPLHHHHDGCPTCSITPDSGYTGDFDPGAFVRDCGRNAPEAGGEGRGT